MQDMMATSSTGELSVISYGITEAEIEATRVKYASLTADTPAGYREVSTALTLVRSTRVGVEKRRVELKAAALDHGRRVDAEAKKWTLLISGIEEGLEAKKKAVDEERERVKAEAAEARQREVETRAREAIEAEDARLRAEREIEDRRLAAERERLALEREALDAQRREDDARRAADERARELARQAEAERLASERRAAEERQALERRAEENRIAAERAELDRERAELRERQAEADRRDTAARVEAETAARIERERVEAVERQAKADKLAAERVAYLESIKPDVDKFAALAATIRALPLPKVKTSAGKRVLALAASRLEDVAKGVEDVESWR